VNPPGDGRADRRGSVAIALALAGAVIALRVWNLGGPPLWLDEAYSANYADLAFSELVPRLAGEATPPLYYLLLGVWTRVLGSSELAVRALSALCSAGAVGVLAALVHGLAGARAARIACALAACAPLQVYYAQEARMYALLGLLAVSLLWAAVRVLERPTPAGLAVAAALSWASLLTHNVAAWWVVGVNVAFLALAPGNRLRVHWLVAQGLAAVAYLPWFRVVLGQLAAQGEVLAWFEPSWRARSPLGHLAASLTSFTLGPFPRHLAIAALPGARWLSLLCAGAVAGGALRLRARREVRLVVIALGVALALSLGYSLAVQPVHIAGRTDQALLLPYLALLAMGLGGLRPRRLAVGATAAFAACALATLVAYYGNAAKEDSQAWLTAVADRARPGDLAIATGLTRAEMDYYLMKRWGLPLEIESYPARLARHPGYVNYQELRANRELLDRDTRDLVRRARETIGAGSRVYVLLTPPRDVNGELLTALASALRSEPRTLGTFQRTGGGPVRLLVFAPP
jgi:uncharacterized membrane protein